MSSPPSSTEAHPLIDVCGLTVQYRDQVALHGVDLSLAAGERLGVVGASGSGKTTLGRAMLGLLPDARVDASRCLVGGTDLLTASPRQRRELRGGRAGLVLQDALASLDPLQRVGDAIVECIRAHRSTSRACAQRSAQTLLAEVELPAPDEMLRRYPHELSGGQRQRVGIALALANDPPLLIADEPTSSLDPPLALQIARLLRDRCDERGTALLVISHDLLLVGAICERLLVLDEGYLVEEGGFDDIARAPEASATKALLQAAGLWISS